MSTTSNDPIPSAIEMFEDQPHDQQQLRQRLLQLIVKSEAKRRTDAAAQRTAAASQRAAAANQRIASGRTAANQRSSRSKLAASRTPKTKA